MKTLPPWVIVHVPHNSTYIPDDARASISLSAQDLEHEISMMTDHHTLSLFTQGLSASQIIESKVSRLVVDVERFECDQEEVMAARGMGVIYTQTHDGKVLRPAPSLKEREDLLDKWYRPHHVLLEKTVEDILEKYGRALVIDAHSFPKRPLPYEINQVLSRPQICIGTDTFHTPSRLVNKMISHFEIEQFEARSNVPFSGALVPMKFYQKEPRVMSVMLEIRRDLYLDTKTFKPSDNFPHIANTIREACLVVLNEF